MMISSANIIIRLFGRKYNIASIMNLTTFMSIAWKAFYILKFLMVAFEFMNKISYENPMTRKLFHKSFQVTKIFFLEALKYFLVSEQKTI